MYEDDNRNLNHMEQNQMPEQNKPERREKRKGGAAKKVAAVTAAAVLFGVVAGGVMTGVNLVGNHLLGLYLPQQSTAAETEEAAEETTQPHRFSSRPRRRWPRFPAQPTYRPSQRRRCHRW